MLLTICLLSASLLRGMKISSGALSAAPSFCARRAHLLIGTCFARRLEGYALLAAEQLPDQQCCSQYLADRCWKAPYRALCYGPLNTLWLSMNGYSSLSKSIIDMPESLCARSACCLCLYSVTLLSLDLLYGLQRLSWTFECLDTSKGYAFHIKLMRATRLSSTNLISCSTGKATN